jgi:hypothetical protein
VGAVHARALDHASRAGGLGYHSLRLAQHQFTALGTAANPADMIVETLVLGLSEMRTNPVLLAICDFSATSGPRSEVGTCRISCSPASR